MSRRRQRVEDTNTAQVELSSGGSITLTFKGSLFELSADEWLLFADLSKMIRRYRDSLIEPGRLAAVQEVGR